METTAFYSASQSRQLLFTLNNRRPSVSAQHCENDLLIWQYFIKSHRILQLFRPDFFSVYKISKSRTIYQKNLSLDLGIAEVTTDRIMEGIDIQEKKFIQRLDEEIYHLSKERKLQPMDYMLKTCITFKSGFPESRRLLRTSFIIHSDPAGLPDLVLYCYQDVSSIIGKTRACHFDLRVNSDQSELETELKSKMKTSGCLDPETTPREREILECLRMGMSSKCIASQLYISKATVDTHRQNMLRKWDLPNTAALVRKALEQGWV